MHKAFFYLLTLAVVTVTILSGCTQKAVVFQVSASVSQSNSSGLDNKNETEESAALQAPKAVVNPDEVESIAGEATSKSKSSELYEEPTFSQEPEDVDRSLTNEMTVRIVDKEGLPVRNIGVYVNHRAGKPMRDSFTYAVSDNEGIAILQRLRTTFSKTEQVTLSLCERNLSKQPQQSVTITIPEDNVTPVDIIWDVPEVNQEVKNTMTFHLDDNAGTPVKNAWFILSETLESNNSNGETVFNYSTGSPDNLTDMYDWNRCTDENGDVSWVNLPEGYYNANVFLYKPPFSNVKSKHPRLKQSFKNPISRYRFYVTGEKEQKLTLMLP